MKTRSMKKLVLVSSCLAALAPLRGFAQEVAAGNRAFNAATLAERLEWHKALAATPRPSAGCFRATYPSTQWQAATCEYEPQLPRLPSLGNGIRLEVVGDVNGDMTAQVPGGISQAEGSFESVSTTGATDSLFGAGRYTLQINTEFFDTSVCAGSGPGSVCQGWEQFIYGSDGRTSMQYWIIDYGPSSYTCPAPHSTQCDGAHVFPDGWCEFVLSGRTYCATNSATMNAGAAAPTALGGVQMQGNAAVGVSPDSVTTTVGGSGVTVPGGNFFPDLAMKWHEAEFNVVGFGNASRVNFDPNTTLVVRTGVDSGSGAAPGCDFRSFTGETNNLSIVDTTLVPLHNGHPSLIFTESNTGPADPSCASGVSIGDTHLTTFDGVHFDFQASGDFLLAEVPGEFTVQVRQATDAPTWPDAAVNKAVAIAMGKTRVVFFVEPAHVTINGVVANAIERPLQLGDGVQLRRSGNVYTVSDKHGNRVRVTMNSTWIDTGVMIGHLPSVVRGLLGNPGGDGASLVGSTGTRFPLPVAFQELYAKVTPGWRVSAQQALFGEASRIKPGVPAREFTVRDLTADAAKLGRDLCVRAGVSEKGLFDDCVLDAGVLGDAAAVKFYVGNPVLQGTVPKPVVGASK